MNTRSIAPLGIEAPHDPGALQAALAEARANPDAFWLRVARARLHWHTPPTAGLRGDFHSVRERPLTWFEDGRLNATVSCVDRHAELRPDKTALLWESDEPGQGRSITYRALREQVSRAANALASLGVKTGDRVVIYMGMVPEAAIAMLACARLGAVHSVVFGGFSAHALADRIVDSDAVLIITQDVGLRGGRRIHLKHIADDARTMARKSLPMLVFQRTGDTVPWDPALDVYWHDAMAAASDQHEPVIVGAEHPLFLLYTSGSTGRPKGLLHTTGGYLAYVSFTHETVFDLREDDVYACVADVGWITGHSYIVYGPLANGATTVLFESTPTHPDPGRYWDLVERYGITIFYGAPTALRTLASQDAGFITAHDRSSLRVLGSVGEPISPETWKWYHDVVGDGRCAVVDTWWQTETGGIAISPVAGVTSARPGSATFPLPGIVASLRSEKGVVFEGKAHGLLCLDTPWPGQARSIWNDHARFVETYFGMFPGAYFTGDGATRDEDGYYWITGRVDDVLNVSGHRMGTAEFESALATVSWVAESAVVGYPHEVKGQGVYAYVVARPGRSPELVDLERACRSEIGAHARIDRVQIVEGLPKTRSGKVMRRILRKIADGTDDQLGDLSTLADPHVVDAIRQGRIRE